MKKMLIMSLVLFGMSGSMVAADSSAVSTTAAKTKAIDASKLSNKKVDASKTTKASSDRAAKAKAAIAARKAANAADTSTYLVLESHDVVTKADGTHERINWDRTKKWKAASILHKDGKRYRVYSVTNKADATGSKVCVVEGSVAPKGHFGRSWLEGKKRCYYIPNDVNNPEKNAKKATGSKATTTKESSKDTAVRAAKNKAAKSVTVTK